MPTPAAERREDDVIALIIADLVRSGCSATILDRPDRNPKRTDGLSVDAELSVDAVPWALDIMTLRWHQGLEGAVQKVRARLANEFGAQLKATGRTLSVTCHVSSDERVIRPLVDLAREAVVSGQSVRRGDEAAQLRPWSPELGPVEVQPWLGQSANLRDEILLSSGEALARKLHGQFSHARGLGYRTVLAIDQNGSPDLKFGGNFLPHPNTIIAAVEQVESAAGILFNILVLVREGDTVHWLRR